MRLQQEFSSQSGRTNVEASEHMNGSRSAPPRHSDRDRSSLDALNRTIEGLEARIQGLMSGSGRTASPAATPVRNFEEQHARTREDIGHRATSAAPRNSGRDPLSDPLAEIRERQRMLEQGGQRQVHAGQTRADMHQDTHSGIDRYRTDPTRQTRRPGPAADTTRHSENRYGAPARGDDMSRPAVAARIAGANQRRSEPGLGEFADALANLRQELKQDISDGVSREMRALREEVRAIRAQAEDHSFAQDVQSDLARLAQGIDQLTSAQASPEAAGLRAEFEELRVVMEGLAREDSIRQMQNRWQGLEERIQEADSSALREELVALAYRIDEIRNQLGLMADSPVIRALEQKLLALAGMMEQLGSRMTPNDAALTEQFGLLDQRLDEITRAIAANSRNASSAHEELAMQRLEGRLAALMEHVETIGRSTSDNSATDSLSLRIEHLAGKIETLAEEQAAAQVEERIAQLSVMVQQLQSPDHQDDVRSHLFDISRKIESLDGGFSTEGLEDKLDYLARRIEEMEHRPRPADAAGEAAFNRIEGRLTDIAARLDEASSAPQSNDEALRGLEAQIAHLSTLIAQPSSASVSWPPEFDDRMAAIEGHLATNDEYIIEAARQAAQTVVDAYSRNLGAGSLATGADMAALSALAEDLKHLEHLTRSSDDRNHQTFEALHGTLVQIADRLDGLEGRIRVEETAPQPVSAAESRDKAAATAFASAPIPAPKPAQTTAQASAFSPALSADVAQELATLEVPTTDTRLRETSAIGSTLSEHIPGPEHIPAGPEQAFPDEPKPAKTGLLSGLTRRFRPAAKPQAAAVQRTVVEPTPPIDPSLAPADVLPPERENDLLEPGSGAPDVKKILERVRASQAAGEFDREKSSERADYIAAARRAAKAAAQEVDPSQMGSLPRNIEKPGKAKDGRGPSTFLRHRRPILMAVGAVLLALMAMPLIKTMTGGQKSQQTAAVERQDVPPEDMQAAIDPAGNPLGNSLGTPAGEAAETPPADTSETMAALPEMPASGEGNDGTTEMADGEPPATFTDRAFPDRTLPESATSGASAPGETAGDIIARDMAAREPVSDDPAGQTPAAEQTTAAEQAPTPPPVPAGIEPKSLADAAAAGDANALFEIGARFSDGRGVQADLAEAAKWYRLSADRGLAPAQYRLGNLLEKGTGIERDLDQAVSYYRRAAEAGNASAMHNLAVLYASGAAGQPDYAEAVSWFRNAADLGVADSQFNLAILYARGNGVRQDLEESYKWFGVAAKDGDTDAAGKRDEVANAMRKEQLDSARAKLDAWQPKPLDPKANSVNLPDEWAAGKGVTTASVDMTKAIRNIQAILNKNGFDAGPPDGKMGAKTTAAIKAFQGSVGQEPTGKVNDALVRELLSRNG
jgi:localization factor PodJL